MADALPGYVCCVRQAGWHARACVPAWQPGIAGIPPWRAAVEGKCLAGWGKALAACPGCAGCLSRGRCRRGGCFGTRQYFYENGYVRVGIAERLEVLGSLVLREDAGFESRLNFRE